MIIRNKGYSLLATAICYGRSVIAKLCARRRRGCWLGNRGGRWLAGAGVPPVAFRRLGLQVTGASRRSARLEFLLAGAPGYGGARRSFLLPGLPGYGAAGRSAAVMSMAVRIVLELGGKNTTVVVQQPMAPAPIPLGTSMAYLPAGCVSITFSSTQYYQCGPNWFRPFFGSNGAYYQVVPAQELI